MIAARATSHAGNASSPRFNLSFVLSSLSLEFSNKYFLPFIFSFFLFFVFLFSTCNTTRTHCLELHFCWALLFRFWAQTYFRIGLEGLWLWQWFTLTKFHLVLVLISVQTEKFLFCTISAFSICCNRLQSVAKLGGQSILNYVTFWEWANFDWHYLFIGSLKKSYEKVVE